MRDFVTGRDCAARAAGQPPPASPTMMRELRTTAYQFDQPFILDSTVTERTFGLAPSDLDTALRSVA